MRLSRRVGQRMLDAGDHAATAESCTGGWIAKACTDIEGSSRWFVAGIVVYSNAAKEQLLRVPGAALRRHGAVSEVVARAMALGAMRAVGANIAVAVTGIAGPGGAVPGKPVGTVWFAWATRSGRGARVETELRRFTGDREAVRRKTVRVALTGILQRTRVAR